MLIHPRPLLFFGEAPLLCHMLSQFNQVLPALLASTFDRTKLCQKKCEQCSNFKRETILGPRCVPPPNSVLVDLCPVGRFPWFPCPPSLHSRHDYELTVSPGSSEYLVVRCDCEQQHTTPYSVLRCHLPRSSGERGRPGLPSLIDCCSIPADACVAECCPLSSLSVSLCRFHCC